MGDQSIQRRLAAILAADVADYSRLMNEDEAASIEAWHAARALIDPTIAAFGGRIVKHTGDGFLAEFGTATEAVECAIKSARKYHWANGNEARIDIITFTGAFHGRSLGAINAGGNPKYLEGFGPKLPGFVHLEWGDHDALKTAAAQPTTAAIFVEPVQGEGGVRAMPDACLIGLRELCDEQGILLIYDEVQCGMGRTGKLFAHEWVEGAAPDILCSAKGIGGGFPFGACLTTEAVGEHMQPGSHESTYGGNPLGCAVGNAVVNIIGTDAFLEDVNRKAGLMRQKLEGLVASHPDVFESVRGSGLMLGLKCKATNSDVVAAGYRHEVITVPAADNVIRLLPPLNITDEDIAEAVSRLDQAASSLAAS